MMTELRARNPTGIQPAIVPAQSIEHQIFYLRPESGRDGTKAERPYDDRTNFCRLQSDGNVERTWASILSLKADCSDSRYLARTNRCAQSNG